MADITNRVRLEDGMKFREGTTVHMEMSLHEPNSIQARPILLRFRFKNPPADNISDVTFLHWKEVPLPHAENSPFWERFLRDVMDQEDPRNALLRLSLESAERVWAFSITKTSENHHHFEVNDGHRILYRNTLDGIFPCTLFE